MLPKQNFAVNTQIILRLTKEKISSLGMKGESYEDIIKRIYSLVVKEQLKNFLMSDKGFVPIEEAVKEADKKHIEKIWRREILNISFSFNCNSYVVTNSKIYIVLWL